MEPQEARKSAQRELDGIKRHRERIEDLERDKEELLDSYEGLAPRVLDSLTPEERYRFYILVRLQVRIHPGHGVEISWAEGEGFSVCENETVLVPSPAITSSERSSTLARLVGHFSGEGVVGSRGEDETPFGASVHALVKGIALKTQGVLRTLCLDQTPLRRFRAGSVT